MTIPVLDAAYALAVAAAGILWAPLVLIVAAAYLITLAVIHDRRTVAEAS